MSIFCTLNIRSESISTLPTGFLRADAGSNVRFVDLESPEMASRRRRVRAKFGKKEVLVDRYWWHLCSDDFVTSDDIYDHLTWIFGCITPPLSLAEHLDDRYTYWLSTYWGFDRPGLGPTILLKTSELLAKHKVELQISLYPEE